MRKCFLFVIFVLLSASLLAAKCKHCSEFNLFASETKYINYCQHCGRNLNEVFQFDGKDIPLSSSGTATPLKISLAGEVGFPWDDRCSVYGFDISVFGSENYAMYGVNVGGLGSLARYSVGVTAGGLGVHAESCGGIVMGGLCTITKRMYGLSIATFVNCTESLYGLQIGLCNKAGKLYGIQIGIFNLAGSDSCGLQIGLMNAMCEKDSRSVLPFINMRF